MQASAKKEVSCKVFTPSFYVLKRKNIDLDIALKNIPYSLDYLVDRHERIEWSVLCTFIKNIRPYLTISDFEEMGAVDIRKGFNQEYVTSGLLMFSLNKFSKRIGENIVKSGKHNVTCIKGEIVSTDNNYMKLKYYVDEEHEYFPEFVYVQRGGLLELGKLFGYKKFNVKTLWVHKGAIFEVSWKNRRTFMGVKKWFFWIFNFRKAFMDLTNSRDQLLIQYSKLEESKILIQKNAIQLKTAYEITKSIRQSLDISKTLNTIAVTLINIAGFSSVYIKLFKDIEGNNLEVESSRKNDDVNTYSVKKQIIINDKEIGELTIHPKIGIEFSECEELLIYVLPIINISIHDSLVLRAIMDYKNNLEQKVTNRTVELEKAKDELSNTNNLLKDAQKVQSNFFANISHEFRTPLTLILGPAEKIKENQSKNPVKDATIITRNSKRLLQLANQLLDLAKADAGKLKLEASKGNIVSFVKGITLSFESLIESKDMRFKIKSGSDLIEIYFDREKMMKVMSNLLSNAFKFSPTGEGVLVSISETENEDVQIKIKNTGVSIPETEIPKLFNRFYQVDPTHTREQEGTGIGLTLVKELVELHHGTISVDSEEKTSDKKHNGWVEFTIILPKGKSHLTEDEILATVEEYEIPEVTVETEQVSKAKKDIVIESSGEENQLVILVVEDNYDMREYIKESLSANYKVEEAVNGEQGIRIAEKIIPDLIISDLMMPKVDGIELTRVLKEEEKTSHIPIIILTAKSGQENLLEGLQTGADEYLTKPFNTNELQIRIRNLFKLRKRIQEKILNGGLTELRSEKKLGVLDSKFITKVNEVIEKHMSDENFSIEEFGIEIGMSRSQFHRKLKALVGESASLYLRSVRLSKAKKMIENGEGNIGDISYETGFSSPSYFTYCFKEEFGYPPSEIR